jgi:CheY-specific phosphatase CheX
MRVPQLDELVTVNVRDLNNLIGMTLHNTLNNNRVTLGILG